MPETNEYRKLPGWGRRHESWIVSSHTTSRLWLGPDHLLQVNSSGGFREDCKRFYYRDIQAFMVQKTERGKYWNFWLGAAGAVMLWLAMLVEAGAWRGFWLFGAALFGSLFAINWLRGPTCKCQLRTAVQTEDLPSLHRLRTARKALARIIPEIEAVQGSVATESLGDQMRDLVTGQIQTVAPPPRMTPFSAPTKPIKPYQSIAHAVLFSILLISALVESIDLFVNHLALVFAETIILAAFCGTVIWALVKQQDSDLSAGVKRLTWGAMAFFVVLIGIGYVHYVTLLVSDPETAQNQWKLMQAVAEMSPFDSGWLMGVFLFTIISSLALGGLGWMFLYNFMSRRNAPAAASQPDSAMQSSNP